MDTKGLLFIPDISGFSRFVTETEIDHSRQIIQELLEVMIDSDRMGLQISEIEGDAILFFRFGDAPDMRGLCEQVQRTFHDFHQRLADYEVTRYCQCRACASAGELTLKIVTHYGEFTSYSVRSFDKLIGRDVIVAHRLLKNDIEGDEYWLVTSGMFDDRVTPDLPSWVAWREGVQETEGGPVAFRYAPLSELRRGVAPAPRPTLDVSGYTKVLSASREYADHIIKLFHATGNFAYRSRWQEGVLRIEEASHYLPRVGMRFRRVTDDGETTIYASSYSFRPDRIEFIETEEGGSSSTRFTVESLDPRRTRVTVDHFVRKGLVRELVFRTTKRKSMQASLERSLANLDALVEELAVSSEY